MFFFRTAYGHRKRRNYFIQKGFQTRFIARFLAAAVVGSAISGYILYLLINRDIEYAFYRTHIKMSTTGELLLPTLIKVNLVVLAAVLVAVAVITLLISRKVAGPLLRLGKDTERMADGDFTGNFRLRTNDELGSLAGSFEEMNRELKGRFDELRRQAEDIDRAAEALLLQHVQAGPDLSEGNNYALRKWQEKLSGKADLFGRKLSEFRTGKNKER